MQDWEQTLADSGHRVTGSRRAVADVLAQTREPLSHQAVYERGRELHPDLGLVTVYRTLDLFEELGLARKVHHDASCSAYMPSSQGHHHAMLCTECGAAVEFPCTGYIAELISNAESTTGFKVDSHLLQLSGVCQECRHSNARTGPAPSPEAVHR